MTVNPALRKAARGFTLIEILIVVAIVGMTLVLAAPNLRSFVSDQRVRFAAADLAQDLAYARVNAISGGKNTVVQPLIANTWMGGWQTYIDLDGNGQFDAAPHGANAANAGKPWPGDILLKQAAPTTGTLKICTTGGGANSLEFLTNIQFRADGSVVRTTPLTANDGLTVSDNLGSVNPNDWKVRSLYFGPSGRISVVLENGATGGVANGVPCP